MSKDWSYGGRIKPRFPPYVGRNMRDRCLKAAIHRRAELSRKELAKLGIVIGAWANSRPVAETDMARAAEIVARLKATKEASDG